MRYQSNRCPFIAETRHVLCTRTTRYFGKQRLREESEPSYETEAKDHGKSAQATFLRKLCSRYFWCHLDSHLLHLDIDVILSVDFFSSNVAYNYWFEIRNAI